MNTFGLQVRQIVARSNNHADQIIRKIAFELLSRVVQKTPVDTGRAKGNWQVGVDVQPSSTLQVEDPSGGGAIARGLGELSDVRAGDDIYIVNNLPYIERLENGSSRQAPNGMVKTTLAELGDIVSEAGR